MKLKLCQTARLEVCYRLESFTAEVKIFRFWLITMDYRVHGFVFGGPNFFLRKAY